MYASECAQWRHVRGVWVRGKVRLRVAASRIHGKGLYAASDMEDGTRLGRLWGVRVWGPGTYDACVSHGRGAMRDSLVLLYIARGMWHVVDVRESVFFWMNCARHHPTVRVTPGGYVELIGDVAAGDELMWHYGDAFVC